MKNGLNIGTGKMKLMAVCLCICSLTAISQEPKTKKQEKKQEPEKAAFAVPDTTKAERPADTLYLEQAKVLNKLDSMINEKQKK